MGSKVSLPSIPFWLLTGSIFILLFVVNGLKEGMFMDGLIYSTIARNMANGIGSFWEPSFTATCLTHFYEHPPLALGIQAVFFRLFGDSLLVERVYSLVAAVITMLFIALIWRQAFKEEAEINNLSWLPCLLWSVLPLNIYSYSNNMLENTMGIFTIASIYCLVRHLRTPRFYLIVMAALLMSLGFMSKGPVGLFPISFFVFAYLVFKHPSKRQVATLTFALLMLPLLILLFFSINEDARMYLSEYLFRRQLLPTLLGQRPSGQDSRFYIIGKLLWAIIPIAIPSLLIYFYSKIARVKISAIGRCYCWGTFFLLLGISASAPIAISTKQYDHYLVPSLPFLALGFAAIMAPGFSTLLNYCNTRSTVYLTMNVFAGMLLIFMLFYLFSQIGKTKTPYCSLANMIGNVLPEKFQETLLPATFRQVAYEQNLIVAVQRAGQIIPPGETIRVQEDAWNNWPLHGYFARFFNISLETGRRNRFFIVDKSLKRQDLDGYEKLLSLATNYELYKLAD